MQVEPLSAIQEVLLDIVADAYSSADSMVDEVRLLLGNGVSLGQIEAGLIDLRDQRLVDAYVRRSPSSVACHQTATPAFNVDRRYRSNWTWPSRRT